MKELRFPVMNVKLVPSDRVVSNTYNPNKVASTEMDLLRISIEEDGVTQPVVTCYDKEADLWVVVDGFHRWYLIKHHFKSPVTPVVEIEGGPAHLMASTVRHNRARGKHQVDLMSALIEKLVKLGWDDLQIAEAMGMEAEEVLRLKQQTGLLSMFKGQDFSRAWEAE